MKRRGSDPKHLSGLPERMASAPPDSDFQVLMAGGYGYGNAGDEAQLAVNIRYWQELKPGVQITVLSPHPVFTEQLHGVHAEPASRVIWFKSNLRDDYSRSSRRFKAEFVFTALRMIFSVKLIRAGFPSFLLSGEELRLIRLIQKADVFHFVGGGYLTGMTRSRLWDSALMMRLSYMLGTPYILSGQTIGVFKCTMDRLLARMALKHAQFIYLRDADGSEKELGELGICGDHVQSLHDDALFCDRADGHTVKEFLTASGIDPDRPYIVINCHYWGMDDAMRMKAAARFAELCDFISRTCGDPLLLVSMHPEDEPAQTLARSLMKEAVPHMLRCNCDYRLIRGVIAGARFVFTMRHHPIVFATGEGVPAVSLFLDDYYCRKNIGAVKNCGLSDYCMDKETFFSASAERLIAAFIRNLDPLRDGIKKQISCQFPRRREVIERFLNRLNAAGGQ